MNYITQHACGTAHDNVSFQARNKETAASEVFDEIMGLTRESDQWDRLSGWELLYLFIVSVPSGDLE